MKRYIIALIAFFTICGTAIAQELTDFTFRVKGMRCEDCSYKIHKVLQPMAGIENMTFDLEKRTVTVNYNPAVIGTDSILAPLIRSQRYVPSTYNANDVIFRGYGQHLPEMKNENDAKRASEILKNVYGVDSVGANLNKTYIFIRYDANKTNKDNIRKVLLANGFTPSNYYNAEIVKYAYYSIPEGIEPEEAEGDLMDISGIDDACINPNTNKLAITYFNDETNAEKLKADIKALGIAVVE